MSFVTVEMARPTHDEKLNAFDRMTFFSYLSTMLMAGISLARALSTLSAQYADPRTRRVLELVTADLEGGRSLSQAMRRFPRSFSPLHVGIVAAGEHGGRLPLSLSRLARHDERWLSLSRQVRAMLVYPVVVFSAALALIIGLAQILVSGVAPVLAEARVTMNPLSAAVFWGATLLRDARIWGLALVCLAGVAALAARWLASPRGQVRRERVLLGLPLVGSLMRRIEVTRICESLATLYECGVPLTTALELTAGSCETGMAREAVVRAEAGVSHGMLLSSAFDQTGLFSRPSVQMVAVAEESGAMSLMLRKIAHYHDLDVRTALDQFTAAIEPIMIGGLGLVVALIIMVAFAPLYQLMSSVG